MFLWLFFGLWWLNYTVSSFKSKAVAEGGTLNMAKFVAGRVVVWLAAGVAILFVMVIISNAMNAGMR